MLEATARRLARTPMLAAGALERLQGRLVTIVGAGVIGGLLMRDLALLQVPLRIIDPERVEAENLGNAAFDADDLGEPKCEARARQARAWNPDAQVEPVRARVEDLGLGVLADSALLLGATDGRPSRVRIDEISRALGIPWIDGAVAGDGESLFGTVTVFDPRAPGSACYLCERDAESLAALAREARGTGCPSWRAPGVPVSPPTLQGSAFAAIVAAHQALFAQRLLLDAEPGLAGSRLLVSCDPEPRVERLALTPNPRCVGRHRPLAPLRRAEAAQLGSLLVQARGDLGVGPQAFRLHHRTLVRGLRCGTCGALCDLLRVASAVDDASLRCDCGVPAEMSPVELCDRLPARDAERMGVLRWSELGLPHLDVVTAIADGREAHYVIASEGSPA